MSDEKLARERPDLFTTPGTTVAVPVSTPTPNVAIPIPVRNVMVPAEELTSVAAYLPEETLLDRLAELSRSETANVTLEEERAAREVLQDPGLPLVAPRETSEPSMAWYTEQTVALIKNWVQEKADTGEVVSVRPSILTLSRLFLQQVPQVPGLTIPASVEDVIPEFQLLCAAVASWAGDLHREIGEDRRTRATLTEKANRRQAELDALRQQYDLPVQLHPTGAELMDAMDKRTQFAQQETALMEETKNQQIAELTGQLETLWQALRQEIARALVEHRQDRETWMMQANAVQDEMRGIIARLEKERDIREEATTAERARWQKNDARIAKFVRQANKSRNELRAKDELVKDLLCQL
ncbi:hypothetical protein R1flu_003721 [Riccia fluitans]|uniref:Uncharacterized protein n=1 Tax=Riccia fluitans TaxID=41844 RepID=A0ABD1Y9U6_9MARC